MARTHPPTQCTIKAFRLRKGYSQEELAQLAGVRRQAIYDMESDKYLPNTAVALRLARILGCTVEALFVETVPAGGERLHLVGGQQTTSPRLALARVRENLVGLPLQGNAAMPFSLAPADGLLRADKQSAEVLLPPSMLEQTVLLMGCDPALSTLNEHMARRAPGMRAHTVFASSRMALQGLAEGTAHIAGTHFHNSGHGEANVEAARHMVSGMPCRIIAFSLLEEGLMVGAGNPLGLRAVDDLARPGIRFVNREQGAALRKLLEAHLHERGIPETQITGYTAEVRSHCEGAYHVACNTADAALGLRVVAESFGLGFVPLAVTRCDLVIPGDLHDHPGVAAILDILQSAGLRRELTSLPGYDASLTGTIIAG